MILPDDVLRSLCDSSDYGKFSSAVQEVRNYLQVSIADSILTRILHRQPLNDRFPIVGKERGLFTRKLVGYNDPRKRVTTPTFDIAASPAVPYRYFRVRDIGRIRRILDESVEAIKEAQIEYFYSLLQSCGNFNEHYPLVSTQGPLPVDLLLRAASMMPGIGLSLVALFLHQEDHTDEIAKAAHDAGVELVAVNPRVFSPEPADRAYYLFAQPVDPELCTGHIMDNRTEFTVEGPFAPGMRRDKERVRLQVVQNSGFLVNKAGVLKISRVWKGKPPKVAEKPQLRQIQAFVIGEEGGDIVCNVD